MNGGAAMLREDAGSGGAEEEWSQGVPEGWRWDGGAAAAAAAVTPRREAIGSPRR